MQYDKRPVRTVLLDTYRTELEKGLETKKTSRRKRDKGGRVTDAKRQQTVPALGEW